MSFSKSALSQIASIIIVVLIVAAAFGSYLVGYFGQRTPSSATLPVSQLTNTSYSIETIIQPRTTTLTTSITPFQTLTSYQILYAPCTRIFQNGSEDFMLNLHVNTTALLCLRFFYYDSNRTTIVNPLNQLSIEELIGNGTSPIVNNKVLSNFNISTVPAEISRWEVRAT